VDWLRPKSLVIQIACALGSGALIMLVGFLIAFWLRGDFQTPPEWHARWQATVDRLVAGGDPHAGNKVFTLIEPTRIIGMGCLFTGFSLCGLWLLRIGEISPRSRAHQLTNVALGMPMLVLLALLVKPQLDQLLGEVASFAVMGITLPALVGVIFPSLTARLFSRPE
jgi:hypothetical protein